MGKTFELSTLCCIQARNVNLTISRGTFEFNTVSLGSWHRIAAAVAKKGKGWSLGCDAETFALSLQVTKDAFSDLARR